jgi:hypothetical protein
MWTQLKVTLCAGAEASRRVGATVLVTLFGVGVLCAPVGAQEGKEVEALWKPQEFTFHYQSFNSFYSCESLESKIEQVLQQVGAEATVRVRSPDCGRGWVRLPRADIQLISPVPATADAVAELKQNESERELIARVTRKTAELKELEKPFAAQWQRVTIGKGRRSSSIDRGDCELLDQLRRRVLPKLAVRVVEENSPCTPNSPSLTRPTIVVEALTAMPKPDDVSERRGSEESAGDVNAKEPEAGER